MEGVTQVHMPAWDKNAELIVSKIDDNLIIEILFDDGFVEKKKADRYQFMLDKDQKGRLLDLLMKDKVFVINSFVFGSDPVDTNPPMPYYIPSTTPQENAVLCQTLPHEIDYDAEIVPKKSKRTRRAK